MNDSTQSTSNAAEPADVQGHLLHFLVPAAVITTGVVLVVREVTKSPEPLPLPSVGSLPTGAPETIRTGGGPIRI